MNNHATTCLVLAASLLPWSALLAQEPSTLDLIGTLSGAQEPTPPDSPATPSLGVETQATGTVDVHVREDGSAFDFVLQVSNGTGVTAAHLHCGPAGVNGPVVVFLTDPNQQEPRDVNGMLAEGTRMNQDIQASAQECEQLIGRPVRNIASLALAAAEGLVYANVHTGANPAGEIRGQLVPGRRSTTTPTPPTPSLSQGTQR